MIHAGSILGLSDLLLGSEPITIVAGAACSRLLPTDIPDAKTWKQMLIDALVGLSGLNLRWEAVASLANASGIPLEAIFAAIDRRSQGLGEELVNLIEKSGACNDGAPNALHRILSSRMIRVPGSAIFTTNFDRCFEQAIEEHGVPVRTWIAGHPYDSAASVFKLHGSTGARGTVRHTFESIGRGFPVEVLNGLAPLCRNKLVVLGYFGADPDVLELLGPGDEVWWLSLPGESDNPRHGVQRFSALRDVQVVTGTFDDLLCAIGHAPIAMGNGRRIASSTQATIHMALDPPKARAALSELTFRTTTADPAMRELDAAVFQGMEDVSGAMEAHEIWRARAVRARYRGGILFQPLRSAWCFWHASLAVSGPARLGYLSDALDAIEMVGLGLIPGVRTITLLGYKAIRHWLRQSSQTPPVPVLAMTCFRIGRSAVCSWLPQLAERALSEALRQRDGDMFLGGISFRWRALARARLGDEKWRDDIRSARELLTFEDRQQELADLFRTEGICVFFASGEVAKACRLLGMSERSHAVRDEPRGVARSKVALRLVHWGVFGRILLRVLCP